MKTQTQAAVWITIATTFTSLMIIAMFIVSRNAAIDNTLGIISINQSTDHITANINYQAVDFVATAK